MIRKITFLFFAYIASAPAFASACIQNEGAFSLNVSWYKGDDNVAMQKNTLTQTKPQACINASHANIYAYATVQIQGTMDSYRVHPSDGKTCTVKGTTLAPTFSGAC